MLIFDVGLGQSIALTKFEFPDIPVVCFMLWCDFPLILLTELRTLFRIFSFFLLLSVFSPYACEKNGNNFYCHCSEDEESVLVQQPEMKMLLQQDPTEPGFGLSSVWGIWHLKKNNSIKSWSQMLSLQSWRIWITYLKHICAPASYQSPPASQEGQDCIQCAYFRCPCATQVAADSLCRLIHQDGHTALLGSEWQCTQTGLFPSELDKGQTLSLFVICFLLLLWHGES